MRKQRRVSRPAWGAWAVAVAGLLAGGSRCLAPAQCTQDGDCGPGAHCRDDGLCESGLGQTPDAGTASGASSWSGSSSSSSRVGSSAGLSGSTGAASSASGPQVSSSDSLAGSASASRVAPPSSSASAAATSLAGASSSSSAFDAGPPACPTRCGAAWPDAGALSWECADGGADLDSCQPTCPLGRAHCDPATRNCDTDVFTSTEHCGTCGNALDGGANLCVQGQPKCYGFAPCPPDPEAGMCVLDSQGNPACARCRHDADCPPGTPLCCTGACVAPLQGCGCQVPPGGNPGEACSATGAGGACVAPATGRVLAVASGFRADAGVADLHGGACGCAPAAGTPVADGELCAPAGGLWDLCVTADGGALGACAPENSPPATATTPAGNCGRAGITCSVSAGGLECLPSTTPGPGHCGCTPGAAGDLACRNPVADSSGRTHVVGDRCLDGACDCAGMAGVGTCALGNTPDCCGPGCVNLQTSTAHCGVCGRSVASAGPAADGCRAGEFACGTGAACSGTTPYCVTGACRECRADADCPTGRPACCGGACLAVRAACGCEVTPGGRAGLTCDPLGAGGACVTSAGAMVSVDGGLVGTLAQLHAGRCGCGAVTHQLVRVSGVCALNGGLYDFCGDPPDGGAAGTCAPQNNPPGQSILQRTTYAGNCGAWNNTCDPAKGGAHCTPAAGTPVGDCSCSTSDFNGCGQRVPDNSGVGHVVARTCSPESNCACEMQVRPPPQSALYSTCDPNSARPECCADTSSWGSGCKDLRTDSINCGDCGVTCHSGFGCSAGACGCNVAADCSGVSTADSCRNNRCVCGAGVTPCPPGQTCCGGVCCAARCCPGGQCCNVCPTPVLPVCM
ncbi:MAG: hypothetical protein HY904_00535 [Deltaproteobacteria bacterium]|nr:hypothetical protein [Deltaproteobacteria bacterium]